MKRIVLSTSTSCLDYMKVPHNIQSIHLHLTINNVNFLDGQNISIDKLQHLIANNPLTEITTAPVSYLEMLSLFSELKAQGYNEVLILTHSAKLSDSFAIINEAKLAFSEQLAIYVFDSYEINISQGLVALDVAEMFMAGASLSAIAQYIQHLADAHRALFVVDDINYLIKSKRLKPTQGFLSNLLDIKPILELHTDGAIRPLDKVRKIEHAIDKMLDYLAPNIQAQSKFMYILNAGNLALVAYLQWALDTRFGITDTVVTPVSPVSLAAHGPGAVGLGVYVDTLPKSAALLTHEVFA